jgi:hypothetical protein
MLLDYLTILQTEGYRRVDMKLNIPEQIKSKLIDDWETVTKDNRVDMLVTVFSASLTSRTASHTSKSSVGAAAAQGI